MSKDFDNKNWIKSLSIWQSKSVIEYVFERAKNKSVIPNNVFPTLMYSYVIDKIPPLSFFSNLSNIFKYSNNEEPEKNAIRLKLLKGLSLALKSHLFLFETEKVKHEPYYYVFPNESDASILEIGIFYPLENEKFIFVTSSSSFENIKCDYKLNGVVSKNPNFWYALSFWKNNIKVALEKDFKEKDVNISKLPWTKEGLEELVNLSKKTKTLEELKKYAFPLEIDKSIKDEFKPLGTLWHPELKTWYLPKGFEVGSVKEYIIYLNDKRK